MKLTVAHQMDSAEWDHLVQRFGGSFFLRPECLSTYDWDYIPCYCTFTDDSAELVGIAFGALVPSPRRMLRHVFRSLYFPTLPVILKGLNTPIQAMIHKLTLYGKRKRITSITFDSFYAQTICPQFERLGFKTRSRAEFILDLQNSEEQIWNRMHPHHRRYAKYGLKRGLTFREDTSFLSVERLIELQEFARNRTQSKGQDYTLPSYQAYLSIKKEVLDKGLGSIFLAEKDRTPISAVLVASYNRGAYLIFAGTSPEGYQLRAPIFLFWNVANELRRRGIIEWNLGGVSSEAQDPSCPSHGLWEFKMRFGTKPFMCVSAEMPSVNKLRSALREMGKVSNMKKMTDFLKHPHVPIFFVNALQQVSPPLARFLIYGRFNINTRNYWNKRYELGEYSETEEEHYRSLRNAIIELVPPKAAVLDLGCGTGRLMEMLRDARLCVCTGIDISDASIATVRSKEFDAFRCRLPRLPPELIGKKFDVCVIVETLEHIPNPSRTIKNLGYMIKDNGYLIIAVPDECMGPEDFHEHLHSFDEASLRKLLSAFYPVVDIIHVESSGNRYLIAKASKVSRIHIKNA